MEKRNKASDSLQQSWNTVSVKWQGEDADQFNKKYNGKLAEYLQTFESECEAVITNAEELKKELTFINRRFQK